MARPSMRSPRTTALACAAVTLCAVLASCGDDEPGPASGPASPTGTASPTGGPGGEKLVLRWRKTGGIAGVGGPGSVPDFSVYSTGRVIVASGPRQDKLTEYRLTPAALRRLLDGARAAGLDRSHKVEAGQISDAFITVVTMGDATTRVVQADSQTGPEGAFLKKLVPDGWPSSDQAAEPKPFQPVKTAVLATPRPTGSTAVPWPLAPLGKGERTNGGICAIAPSEKVPASHPTVTWSSAGEKYMVRLRPLLPAESTCRDIA